LEGRECREVLLSEVLIDIFRLDSEPFQKIYLNKFNTLNIKKLSEIAICNPGKSEISKLDNNTNVSFVPMASLGSGIINQKQDGIINDYKAAGYTYFYENDILIAKITPCMEHGKCAIARGLTNNIGFGSTEYNVFRVNNNDILTEYLFVFLNRENIRKNAEINMIGTSGRQRVPIAFYENLLIPIPSLDFQHTIKKLIDKSYNNHTRSHALYTQAEDLLLSTLGLHNFTPRTDNITIKNITESFLKSGRLDAEYYQPKYEEMEEKIKEHPFELLGDLVTIKKSIEPGSDAYSDEGLPFIRVSDYNKFGIAKAEKCLSSSFCNEKANLLPSLYPTKDTILFSKDGSIGIAHKVREDMQAITSGALLHLKVKDETKVLPDYLTLVLNSNFVQLQAERDAGGSIIKH